MINVQFSVVYCIVKHKTMTTTMKKKKKMKQVCLLMYDEKIALLLW